MKGLDEVVDLTTWLGEDVPDPAMKWGLESTLTGYHVKYRWGTEGRTVWHGTPRRERRP